MRNMNDEKKPDSVETIKTSLREVKEEVESFIREHPLASAGIAAFIGFTLARILKGRD